MERGWRGTHSLDWGSGFRPEAAGGGKLGTTQLGNMGLPTSGPGEGPSWSLLGTCRQFVVAGWAVVWRVDCGQLWSATGRPAVCRVPVITGTQALEANGTRHLVPRTPSPVPWHPGSGRGMGGGVVPVQDTSHRELGDSSDLEGISAVSSGAHANSFSACLRKQHGNSSSLLRGQRHGEECDRRGRAGFGTLHMPGHPRGGVGHLQALTESRVRVLTPSLGEGRESGW